MRKSDFEHLEARLTFRNRTSNYTVGEKEFRVVREFREKGLVFEVPRKSCALGHALDFEVTLRGAAKSCRLIGAGRVIEVDAVDDELQTIVIEFFQYSEPEWSKLRELYASRQEEILSLLQNIRGF